MMPEEAPVSDLPTQVPDPKEFWAIYPHTLDWQILVMQLIRSKSPGYDSVDPKIAVVGWRMNTNEPQIPIYYLAREHFPVEKIAAFIGRKPGDLVGVEAIHLREFKDATGKVLDFSKWEKPNVDYWGFA